MLCAVHINIRFEVETEFDADNGSGVRGLRTQVQKLVLSEVDMGLVNRPISQHGARCFERDVQQEHSPLET